MKGLEEAPNILLMAAIGLVLGMILGILAVLFKVYMKEENLYQTEKEVACDEEE